jgi:hypothetical protein
MSLSQRRSGFKCFHTIVSRIAAMASRHDHLEDVREQFAPACNHIRALVAAARTLGVQSAGDMNLNCGDVGIRCWEYDLDTGSSCRWSGGLRTTSFWTC